MENSLTPSSKKENKLLLISIFGTFLVPIVWATLKYIVGVSDRFLPSFRDVVFSLGDFEPSIFTHTLSTIIRLFLGFSFGIICGISLGVLIYRYEAINRLLMPTIQSFRSVPPIATVPFFILWFGFTDTGRYFMVLFGIAFNIAIASHQVLTSVPEKYKVMFNGFGQKPQQMVFSYMLPKIGEEILPTIRFSLSTAIGLVIVSELLGAQVGLGYLIQTSRSTYSMHVIFLAMILLGIINLFFDKSITSLWKKIIFWKSL
jgi:ABC-type nitrate/sulfonate/bicarbonate transport system permease component